MDIGVLVVEKLRLGVDEENLYMHLHSSGGGQVEIPRCLAEVLPAYG